jgi:hypothetical protein
MKILRVHAAVHDVAASIFVRSLVGWRSALHVVSSNLWQKQSCNMAMTQNSATTLFAFWARQRGRRERADHRRRRCCHAVVAVSTPDRSSLAYDCPNEALHLGLVVVVVHAGADERI